MKHLTLSAVALAAIASAGIVMAADLQLRGAMAADLHVKVPPAVPYLASDPFNGFYVGINGGYGFDLGTFGLGPATINDLAGSPQGFVGGVQAGYNWHMPGSWIVLGVEGDIDGAALTGNGNIAGVITAHSKNSWLTSLRARLGIIPIGHAMLYATAGYGWGGGEFTVADLATRLSSSVSPTMSGLVWGAGLETPLFSPNWLGRIEYLQYDFGDFSTALAGVAFTQKDRVDVVRGAISYKFSTF